VIDPTIAGHKGGIVKNIGDGLLVEFASVVDALRCAAELQATMVTSNAPLAPERCIAFRIGIHQGDIVFENRDILGDGVNIAARPKGPCPGGCRSPTRRRSYCGSFGDLSGRRAYREARSLAGFSGPVLAFPA